MKITFLTNFSLLKRTTKSLTATVLVAWPEANKHSLTFFEITINFISVSHILSLICWFLARDRNRLTLSLCSVFSIFFSCSCVLDCLYLNNWYSHNRYHDNIRTNLNIIPKELIRFLVLLLQMILIRDHLKKLSNTLLSRQFILYLLWW